MWDFVPEGSSAILGGGTGLTTACVWGDFFFRFEAMVERTWERAYREFYLMWKAEGMVTKSLARSARSSIRYIPLIGITSFLLWYRYV